ncbi:hypothetical protein ABPG72_018061 [Tetrahymena utriculariae]
MSAQQKQTFETFEVNKELVAIFTQYAVGAQRLQILKWIKDLVEKPKHAHKEEEKLKGLLVEEAVIQEIIKGDTEYRITYFNNMLQKILEEFNQAKVKEGNIYMRSLTLKRWKEKKVRLDEINKQFVVLSKRKQKQLNLNTYSVKWVGQKKDYQAFSLNSLSPQNKYKQLLFGWVNFDGARLWHDSILRLLSKQLLDVNLVSDRLGVQSVQIKSSQDIFGEGQLKIQKNQDSNDPQEKRRASLQMSLNEEQLEKAEKPTDSLQLNIQHKATKKEEMKSSQQQQEISNSSKNDLQVSGDKQIQNDISSSPSSKQQQQILISASSSPMSKQNIEKQEKVQQNQIDQSQAQKKLQEQQQQQQQQESQLLKPQVQQQQQQQPSSQSKSPSRISNSPSSMNQDNNQINQQQLAEQQKQILKQRADQALKQQTMAQSITVDQYLEHIDEIKTPQTVQQLLISYKLEMMADERDFKSISFSNGMSLLQSTEDPRRFKIFLAFQGVSAFEIFNSICNIDDYSKWNSNVAEAKVLNIMKNEQTCIIYQKHKGIGIMYRPRDFVYLRHAFVKDQSYYLIDKSIEYDSIPSIMSIVRGEIEHVVWCFKTHKDDESRSLVIADFYYNNSGYSNKEQDASITFAYINNFSNLSQFITQKSFQKSIKINMFDIGDLTLNRKTQKERDEKGRKNNLQESVMQSQLYKSIDPNNVFQSIQLDSQQLPYQQQYSIVINQSKLMTKIEENQDESIPTLCQINSKTELEQIDQEEKEIVKKIYEEEEIQNAELNVEISKFCEEIHKNDNKESKNIIENSQALIEQQQEINKPGNKLAGMTIPQIIEFVNENKHWKICLDQKFNMGRIDTEPSFITSDPEKGHYQFKKNWERDTKTGKFIFLNQEKINTQKKVISFILSKIGSNILSGKSITSISLPIDIFEPRSNLERFAYSCAFAPIYLKKAAELTDPIEQMKNCAIYLITTTIMYLDLEKPFNPILGETYQGRLDGYPFYCEQICHHPPVCAYSYYTDTYKLTGGLESIAQMHANSVTGLNQGNVFVKFHKTGNEIGLIQAPGSLNGTTFGTRYMSVDGKYLAFDIKNKLVLDIKVNPDKKGFFKSAGCTMDYMAGGIYRVNDKFITKLKSLHPHYYKFQGLNLKDDVVEQVSTITGIWNKEIFIDDVKWFDIENPFPFKLEHELNPIPSDCNYRQDILYLKDRNLKDGQTYKELLENYQRADRKLREKANEQRKKNMKKKK